MPDLNLIDDSNFEESPAAPAAPPPKRKQYKSSGGGAGKTILIIFLLLAVIGGGLYFAYQRGYIKLPFKKKQSLAQMQDEPFIQDQTGQVAQTPEAEEPKGVEPKQPDTSVALIETPNIEEKAEAMDDEGAGDEEKSEGIGAATKLSDMKGDYTVQVIAYSEKSKAVETSKNLVDAGYPAFVEKVPMKGGEWYTVRIGRYASPAEAEKAVKDFADELKEHYVIDKIRTK